MCSRWLSSRGKDGGQRRGDHVIVWLSSPNTTRPSLASTQTPSSFTLLSNIDFYLERAVAATLQSRATCRKHISFSSIIFHVYGIPYTKCN